MKIHVYSLLMSVLVFAPLMAEDWKQFRGPNGSGISTEKNLPVKWDAKTNLRWKADLPGRGLSNPVIANGRVYVTAASGYQGRRLHVICFDEATGEKLWERQFAATGSTGCNRKTNMAAPTPVTDGKVVYALFATGDLAALDRDGNLLWYRSLVSDYPTITNQVGMASSPTLAGDVLVVPMENIGESFLAGLDGKTGTNLWKIPRPQGTNWTSPIVFESKGQTNLLFHNSGAVVAYDVRSGKENWNYPTEKGSRAPSLVASKELIFVPGSPLVALRPGKPGQTPELVWKSNRLSLGHTSPVFHDGKLYGLVRNVGVTCLNAEDGERIWQQRLKGTFYASPVIADGKLYIVNEEGQTSVLELGDKSEVLSVNELDDEILATPAIANGAIYLRSDRHLYCIGEKK